MPRISHVISIYLKHVFEMRVEFISVSWHYATKFRQILHYHIMLDQAKQGNTNVKAAFKDVTCLLTCPTQHLDSLPNYYWIEHFCLCFAPFLNFFKIILDSQKNVLSFVLTRLITINQILSNAARVLNSKGL